MEVHRSCASDSVGKSVGLGEGDVIEFVVDRLQDDRLGGSVHEAVVAHFTFDVEEVADPDIVFGQSSRRPSGSCLSRL